MAKYHSGPVHLGYECFNQQCYGSFKTCLLHGGEKAIADNTYNKSNQDMQHASMN